LVGMGMPLQENWILQNRNELNCPVVYSTGAAIEYFSGAVERPPAWISDRGFEWLFRLKTEPRKLWRRYLIEPFFLLVPAFRDIRARLAGRSG
jgi:N-acetylglucosaminyldiphosphoundecaprenol N-acetyl-beta-D-mannosaminyltransferase